jgi:hypothetical protein
MASMFTLELIPIMPQFAASNRSSTHPASPTLQPVGHKYHFIRRKQQSKCKYNQCIQQFDRHLNHDHPICSDCAYTRSPRTDRTKVPRATWRTTCSNSAPSPSTRHVHHIVKNPLPPLYHLSSNPSSMMNMNPNVHVTPVKKHHVTAHEHAHYTANTC